jgi:hypothetical protein
MNSSACEELHWFPGVASCMDDCHLSVRPPSADRDSFINRNGTSSIKMLAVCCNNMKLMFTHAEKAGSIQNAGVF